MKLTGKCKEKFIFWMCSNHEYVRWHEYETMPDILLNALIIEFFDTKQYKGEPLFKVCFSFYWANKTPLQSFNDVCIQAIEKANEILNLNNKLL